MWEIGCFLKSAKSEADFTLLYCFMPRDFSILTYIYIYFYQFVSVCLIFLLSFSISLASHMYLATDKREIELILRR